MYPGRINPNPAPSPKTTFTSTDPSTSPSQVATSPLCTDDTLETIPPSAASPSNSCTNENPGWLWPVVESGVSLASNAVVNGARWYHNYRVSGLENIPKTGPVLLVLNHSLATYDVVLLVREIEEKTGRTPKPLVDRLFFKVPGVCDLARKAGMVEGSRENARDLLNAGELVIVLPGGMKEALRPSTEKYDVRWDTRKGFVRIALETGANVIIGACPAADDIYSVYGNPLTRAVYSTLRAPAPVFAGRYYTPLPMPAPLTHVLSKPIPMPQIPGDKHLTDSFVDGKHKQLVKVMDSIMTDALLVE